MRMFKVKNRMGIFHERLTLLIGFLSIKHSHNPFFYYSNFCICNFKLLLYISCVTSIARLPKLSLMLIDEFQYSKALTGLVLSTLSAVFIARCIAV